MLGKSKDHLPLLDILRIAICAMVLLFHAVIHRFWIIPEKTFLHTTLSTGAIYMEKNSANLLKVKSKIFILKGLLEFIHNTSFIL